MTAAPARVFEHQRIWQLDRAAFDAAASLIAAAEHPHQPQLIIGIARGGRDLATALSRHLQIPAVMITARHNASDQIALPAAGTVGVDLSPLGNHARSARLLVGFPRSTDRLAHSGPYGRAAHWPGTGKVSARKAGTMTDGISLRSRVAGAALRRYREAIGYQLEDAARVLDCDRSKISRVETGQRGIRVGIRFF